MKEEIINLTEDVSSSPLYNEDFAPVPKEKRTWGLWDMTAIWIGMAVCIPTYLLASYMMKAGLSWVEALIIIILGNIIITIPMVLNGHAGVKYGIPFPVIGRAAFGTRGIHIASVVRGIVACGWFGIQTWIGGLAIYAIWNALTGSEASVGLDLGKFIGFGLFWLINIYFIVKGTESIKKLEKFSAPILIGIGILLIAWGAIEAGGFTTVLKQSKQLGIPTAELSEEDGALLLQLNPIKDKDGNIKASESQLTIPTTGEDFQTSWIPTSGNLASIPVNRLTQDADVQALVSGKKQMKVQFRAVEGDGYNTSSVVNVKLSSKEEKTFTGKLFTYLLWLTAMVGFWATMAISIADITRYTATQKNQVRGQFLGLPGTMALYSFVGIFVTCAALINFGDILIADDAPWDPVSLLAKFESPVVVVIAQIFMLIATLSTNIAANVIAPANAFSNIAPKKISFTKGGLIAAVIGIIICPWWLLDEISSLLLFVSSFLGPVLGILICDYFSIRKKKMNLNQLFKVGGKYSYGGSGFNPAAMVALAAGVFIALLGLWVPAVSFLYTLSWFTGFGVSYLVYYLMLRKKRVRN
jgi:cytosine/uracil/thiamine/allantoin permease